MIKFFLIHVNSRIDLGYSKASLFRLFENFSALFAPPPSVAKAKMKPLDPSILKEATNRLEQGESIRAVACRLGVSKSSVGLIRKRSNVRVTPPRSGAPKKLSPREARDMALLVRKGEVKTAVQATQVMNSRRQDPVSSNTVRRALREARLKAVKKVKKPMLSARHRKVRLNWALRHRDWTVADWKKVIWSDESKINRICSDGIQYAWIDDTDKLCDSMVIPTLKYGGGNIMVWGCFTWFGVGNIHIIQGLMNAQMYCDILSSSLVPTLDALFMINDQATSGDILFQQDNDPKHTSRLAKEWFDGHNVVVMDWPAQSPDLNPIENLWSILKRRLGSYKSDANGVHELWDRVKKEWQNISVTECRRLVESMPRRIEAVIKARGGPSEY